MVSLLIRIPIAKMIHATSCLYNAVPVKKIYEGCCTTECQQVFNLPLEEQRKLREGAQNGMMVFNKSKQRLRPRLNFEEKNVLKSGRYM